MDNDDLVGLVLVVLGVLVLLGELSVGFIIPVLGVLLVVLGVLMLADVVEGSTAGGVVTLVVGLLLYSGPLGAPGPLVLVLNLVVGVILVVMGVQRLR